jgi:preprotein translocase subunit SecE
MTGVESGMSWTEQTREFFKEVQVEFGKISWPSRQELRDSTIVVIFTVLIVAAFVGAVDQLLNLFVHLLFG